MDKSKLIVISGPSGVGKGTIVKKILENNPDFELSVSATTRYMRDGEINGKDYYFMTEDEFKQNIENNNFAEYAKYADNYYGTLCSFVNERLSAGKILILEIDVQGAFQIKNKYPDAKLIFIMPPNVDELKKRLLRRNTESEQKINLRISNAQRELSFADEFDYKIINDNLDVAIEKIINVILN